MTEIALYDLAHARTGDKGNTINIGLIAYAEADYPLLAEQVTPERVAQWFAHDTKGREVEVAVAALVVAGDPAVADPIAIHTHSVVGSRAVTDDTRWIW